ncbi:Putative oxidoreductase YdbC [Nocardia africana]|uniref:Oxidoreductase YdbC n=1 Tax=Nocardia africana TaxID=134964 RepID=A0A378WNS7_9NOCA|nr:Putative oxidoreductase YdbC [Nocardia africana]
MTVMTQPRDGELAGRAVGRIGYGAMQLESGADGVAVLRRAVELGVSHIDTAGFYGNGSVNALLREALHPYPDDLLLVDKVGAMHTGDGLVPAQRPGQLRAAVEADLRALGAEQLAVVNLRRVDGPPGIVATGDQIVDLDDQLAELMSLRDEGKVGAIGLSNVTVEQLRRAAPRVSRACRICTTCWNATRSRWWRNVLRGESLSCRTFRSDRDFRAGPRWPVTTWCAISPAASR